MTHIYHITSKNAANLARRSGEYRAESLAAEGFIHFSQIFQILGVADAFYAGQMDLVILVVEPSLLKAELKYEAPVHPRPTLCASAPVLAGDNLFPHLYGTLNFDAVEKVVDFSLGVHGGFELPTLP